MKPMIGISAGREVGNTQFYKINLAEHYTNAILRAGGTPLILPTGLSREQVADVINKVDGIVITGGGDVDPQIFNGLIHPRISGVDPLRDELEIQMVIDANQTNKPCLGICRGHQIINVAFGGTLFTDIASQIELSDRHDWYPDVARDYSAHKINIHPGSKLEVILGGSEIYVNSLHHQAIKDLAAPLKTIATAPDGIIEAIEKPDHPLLMGVQWHPEWMVDSPAMKNLFLHFVNACIV